MRRAVVPGTFDPITSGHLDIIERAAGLYDEVVVGVATSAGKNGRGTVFTPEERVAMVGDSIAHLANVSVAHFDGLLVDFAHQVGATAIVKGLRALTDFEHEFQMAALNWRMGSDVETVFIMSVPEYMYLSSSAVREIVSHGGQATGLVPAAIERRVTERLGTAI